MLELKNVYKTYSSKNGVTYRALENVSLKFDEKGLVFILGKSGSGKSTLLNIIGGLDNFDRGDVLLDGKSFKTFNEKDFNAYRNNKIGFVFQDFCLLDNLTVFDNVALSLNLQSKKDNALVNNVLKQVDVDKLKRRKTSDLSGGQKQRVAIARALIKNPEIILADEPTGSLDSENSEYIVSMLKKLAETKLVIVVTHNKELAESNADRIIEIRDGFVLKDLMLKKDGDVALSKPQFISNNLLYIPKGKQISQEQIEEINDIISEKRQDYYFLIEKDKRRVVSIFPNIKEVLTDNDNKGKFIPYEHLNDNASEFKKIKKSSLPLVKGIKFGLSNLQQRKLKLFFSVFLAILSVLFTGAASNFTKYNLQRAVARSLQVDSNSYLEVSSSFSIADENYKMQASDITKLENLGHEVAKAYDFDLALISSSTGSALSKDNLFDGNFTGFLQMDDITEYGYSYIEGGAPDSDADFSTGVIISSTVAESIARYNNNYRSAADLKNERLMVNTSQTSISLAYSSTFTIIGILDANYSRYSSMHTSTSGKTNLYNEYKQRADNVYSRIIMSTKAMQNYLQNKVITTLTTSAKNFSNVDVTTTIAVSTDAIAPSTNSIRFLVDGWTLENYDEKVQTLKENQIFVSRQLFALMFQQNYVETEREQILAKVASYNEKGYSLRIRDPLTDEVYFYAENIEVIGVILSNRSDNTLRGVYINDNSFERMVKTQYMPSKVFVKMDKDDSFDKVIETLYSEGFTIDNEFVEYFLEFSNLLQTYSSIINIVAVLWFIVVAMLLYSFMSSSIRTSRHQIGVLKALGASVSDLYKIYTVEAVIIGLFATVVGVAGYHFGGLLVNSIVTKYFYTFYFPIFISDTSTILLMIFSTLIVLLVALVVPISRVSKIKPIDVMNRE